MQYEKSLIMKKQSKLLLHCYDYYWFDKTNNLKNVFLTTYIYSTFRKTMKKLLFYFIGI